jgi:acetylglutamate kinase
VKHQEPITIIKLGGSLLDDPRLRAGALDAVAAAWHDRRRMLIVHGGGKHVDRMMVRVGLPKIVVDGLRVTDAPTLQIVVQTLAGAVNKMLVSELKARGVVAAGLTGADAAIVIASQHPPVGGEELGFVGTPERVDRTVLDALLSTSVLPLLGSIAIGSDGRLFNVNADSVAAAVAAAYAPSSLVFLTDVEGVLAEGSVVEELTAARCQAMLASSVVTGGMRPKLHSALNALDHGVEEVVIAGPSRHTSVLMDGKGGTHLVAA